MAGADRGAAAVRLISDIPTVGTELPPLPGMSFGFEPNSVIGD